MHSKIIALPTTNELTRTVSRIVNRFLRTLSSIAKSLIFNLEARLSQTYPSSMGKDKFEYRVFTRKGLI
jgi:hypothetical protein